MPFIYILAAASLAVFFSSFFMGVNVVGVCRYGTRYRQFFDRLRSLGTLATIKEMARVYLKALNIFLGPTVGMKQDGVLDKSKYFGLYVEHLFLLYWVGATILVFSFRPVEPQSETTSSLQQAAAFAFLLTINIASDAFSLIWTKRCIARIVVPKTSLTLTELLNVLAQDVGVAAALMVFVQFISNGLYAVQIGRPENILLYMLDPKTALKSYHAIDPSFSTIEFPGQLVITCTTYIPSILFYLTCVIIVCLIPFYKLLVWLLSIFNPESGPDTSNCSQFNFVTMLTGIGAVAMASAGVFVSAWPLIRPS
jgi:uncharacterized membrane protein